MWRILGVTALVSVIGGLAGAAAGMLVMAGAIALTSRIFWSLQEALEVATVIGFIVGGFLSPVMTWLFLRRVPLWRASVETAFAATIGLVLSALLGASFPMSAAAALACSLLAAMRLKRAFRIPEQAPQST